MHPMLPVPTLKHLYTLFASFEQPVDFGKGPYGYRRSLTITSGYFKGDRLKGKILPGGGDHLIMCKDGEVHTDTRYNLQTDDGANIYAQSKGCRRGPKHLLRKILEGHTLTEQESEQVIFHMTVTLETGDRRYDWLNQIVVVATARRTQFGIGYDAYELCNPTPRSPPPLNIALLQDHLDNHNNNHNNVHPIAQPPHPVVIVQQHPNPHPGGHAHSKSLNVLLNSNGVSNGIAVNGANGVIGIHGINGVGGGVNGINGVNGNGEKEKSSLANKRRTLPVPMTVNMNMGRERSMERNMEPIEIRPLPLPRMDIKSESEREEEDDEATMVNPTPPPPPPQNRGRSRSRGELRLVI